MLVPALALALCSVLQSLAFRLGLLHTEKSLPFLFKRYMQASTDHARKYGGTGLGPAICKQLDVHMPEMDCLQATRLIRSFENTGYWEAFVNPEDNPMLAN